MGQKEKTSLILPLVEHMLKYEVDIDAWRHELSTYGAMSFERASQLTESEVKLAFATMKAVQFQSLNMEDLLDQIESHHVSWRVDMDDSFQQGAICY